MHGTRWHDSCLWNNSLVHRIVWVVRQCVAVYCSVLYCKEMTHSFTGLCGLYGSVLQRVAVCCNALQCVAMRCGVKKRLTHMCDMPHPYVWHNSFICATWLIHMCDMTHSQEILGRTSCGISEVHIKEYLRCTSISEVHIKEYLRCTWRNIWGP